jgi:hypothetical protein
MNMPLDNVRFKKLENNYVVVLKKFEIFDFHKP